MNQRIGNLDKWRLLEDGSAISFEKTDPRVVVLEVNSPSEAQLYIAQVSDTGVEDTVFLAAVKGRDRVEFAVEGAFDLLATGGDVYIYTFDGLDTATHIVAPEIYTRLAKRRVRNPNLEMVEYRMRLNQERFFAQLERDAEARIEAVKNEFATYKADRNPVAPAHLVGKASAEDSVSERESEEVVADAEPAAKRSGRKSKAADDDDD